MPALTEAQLIDAIRKIRDGQRQLGEALERYRSALAVRIPVPFCVIDSYSFGRPIFNPKPVRSRPSEKFDRVLLYGIGFPLGIIVQGYAEVTSYPHGAGVPRGVPQAILKPGDFVGSFEFMDWCAEVSPKGASDWVVTAGVSIRCAFSTDNDAFAKHLVRKFPRVNRHAIRTASPFSEQIKKIEHIQNCFEKCKTHVIYFGSNWFQEHEEDTDDIRSARSELMGLIGRLAWRASARIRPTVIRSSEFFFKGSASEVRRFTRPDQHERSRAIHIFTSLYDLFSGRRPMFIPERKSGPWGPIQEICEALRGYDDDEKPFVLRPDYICDSTSESTPSIGFMPAESIGSDLVEGSGSHRSALEKSLHTIDQAAKVAAPEGGSILDEFDNIILALSVRLPAEKKSGHSKGFIEYDVRRDSKQGVKLVEMGEGQFFEPSDISPRGPGAEFFKTCIRLSTPTRPGGKHAR